MCPRVLLVRITSLRVVISRRVMQPTRTAVSHPAPLPLTTVYIYPRKYSTCMYYIHARAVQQRVFVSGGGEGRIVQVCAFWGLALG